MALRSPLERPLPPSLNVNALELEAGEWFLRRQTRRRCRRDAQARELAGFPGLGSHIETEIGLLDAGVSKVSQRMGLKRTESSSVTLTYSKTESAQLDERQYTRGRGRRHGVPLPNRIGGTFTGSDLGMVEGRKNPDALVRRWADVWPSTPMESNLNTSPKTLPSRASCRPSRAGLRFSTASKHDTGRVGIKFDALNGTPFSLRKLLPSVEGMFVNACSPRRGPPGLGPNL